jgi:hypothetical protein
MQDFERVLQEGGDLLKGMLRDYQKDIQKAYLKVEDLKVSMGLKLTPAGDGIKVETSINFVESKITDTAAITVSDTVDMFKE